MNGSYEVIKQKDGIALLRCRLYSGKTHQIRVHLKDVLGIELLNDSKYGEKRKMGRNQLIDPKAFYLHCHKISILYNGTKKTVGSFD